MSNIEAKCLNCNKIFYPRKADVKRGLGKYCCMNCGVEFRMKQHKLKPKVDKAPNTECFLCNKAIWRKDLSKSKSGKHFCCNEHKNIATELDKGNSDLWAYKEASGKGSYRKRTLRSSETKRCEQCGYSEHIGALRVHHKDRNRENNKLENLQILCPNCHEEVHYLTDTGRCSANASQSAKCSERLAAHDCPLDQTQYLRIVMHYVAKLASKPVC